MLKVLFVVPYPIDAPSTRYRVEQYLPYLQAHGVQCDVARFIASRSFYLTMYRPGRNVRKALYTVGRMAARLAHIWRSRRYDVIFIQREAAPYGPAFVEQLMARLGTPLVYDFDDAVYLRRSTAANRWAGILKQPQKTARIIEKSAHVIAGNRFLAAYAQRYSQAVTIIPTTLDCDRYTLRPNRMSADITIGWIGTTTNVAYLRLIQQPLAQLAQRHAFRLLVVGGEIDLPGVPVVCKPWRLENEIADLHAFDIGIMPLVDDEWTRGKCGFKALQYMAVGTPAVVSPVGVNADFIQSGQNGFLADSADAWLAHLSALIESAELRQTMGLAGRQTVVDQFSLRQHAPRLLTVLQTVAGVA